MCVCVCVYIYIFYCFFIGLLLSSVVKVIVPPRHMLSGGCIEQDTSAMKEACEMSKVPVIRRRRASSIEIPTASQNGVKSTSTKTRRKSLPALGGQVKVRAFFYWIELKSDDRFPNFHVTDSDLKFTDCKLIQSLLPSFFFFFIHCENNERLWLVSTKSCLHSNFQYCSPELHLLEIRLVSFIWGTNKVLVNGDSWNLSFAANYFFKNIRACVSRLVKLVTSQLAFLNIYFLVMSNQLS